MTILLWHRRDLRIHDNPALSAACARGEVIPVYFFDEMELKQKAAIQVQFILDSLRELAASYQQLGGRLILRQGDTLQVLVTLIKETGAKAVYFNDDIEPEVIKRVQKLKLSGQELGFDVTCFQDMMLHPPELILTQQKTVYGVYGAYARNWFSQTKATPYPAPERITTPEVSSMVLPTLKELGLELTIEAVPAGEQRALKLLDNFSEPHKIFAYQTQRNFPAEEGTSQLSPHLTVGTIGIRTVWQRTVELEAEAYSEERAESLRVWQQELAWRDFYKYTLFHFPHIEYEAYQKRFNAMVWDDNTDYFTRWCAGETGYPLVDAAMRQLNETGWMHNRCRMVVASFLCKDLMLDWRWGERYFIEKLVDGDLAANNGGWQWSASVGTDPKPLRIFNPQTQLTKFDPDTRYVRQWIPQLRRADKADIFMAKNLHRYQYPKPIVDHKKQQELFKQRYNQTRLS
jgi:deoxyribodipyrimidine photo-lyase